MNAIASCVDLSANVQISFADVHYYFDTPSPRPVGDRFDTGSYLYLHGGSTGRGARLEIANHVGKPEQDAFTGCRDPLNISQGDTGTDTKTV